MKTLRFICKSFKIISVILLFLPGYAAGFVREESKERFIFSIDIPVVMPYRVSLLDREEKLRIQNEYEYFKRKCEKPTHLSKSSKHQGYLPKWESKNFETGNEPYKIDKTKTEWRGTLKLYIKCKKNQRQC